MKSKRECALNVDYVQAFADQDEDQDDYQEEEDDIDDRDKDSDPSPGKKSRTRAARKDARKVAHKDNAASSGKHAIRWDTMFERLRTYRYKNGNCKVPRKYSDSELAHWVANQRKRYNQEVLSVDRIQRLNSIGFAWRLRNSHVVKNTAKKDIDPENPLPPPAGDTEATDAHNDITSGHPADIIKWNTMFERLGVYQDTHGNCNVSGNYSDLKLANWVRNQRKLYKMQVLPADRIQRLNSIGFAWRLKDSYVVKNTAKYDAQWLEKLEELKTFKKREGHPNVPRMHDALISWVQHQRYTFKVGIIRKDRIDLLNGIGFEWQGRLSWEHFFAKLVEHKERTGTLKVKEKDDKQLHNWVCTQRSGQGTLSLERRARMEGIGFDFQSQYARNQYTSSQTKSKKKATNKEAKKKNQPKHSTELEDSPSMPQPATDAAALDASGPEDNERAQSDTAPSGQESNHQAAEVSTVVDTLPSAAVTGQENTVDLDSLTLIVSDLSDLLDEPGATKEIHKCERYLTLMIKIALKRRRASKGKKPVVLGMDGEDAFARLIPLVDALVEVLDASREEDVNTFQKCERFLCHIRDKAKKAKNAAAESEKRAEKPRKKKHKIKEKKAKNAAAERDEMAKKPRRKKRKIKQKE